LPDGGGGLLRDTTSQHKSHLFDLHCKICTGKATNQSQSQGTAAASKRPRLSEPVLVKPVPVAAKPDSRASDSSTTTTTTTTDALPSELLVAPAAQQVPDAVFTPFGEFRPLEANRSNSRPVFSPVISV